jgi:hypothetical protein
MVTGGGCSINDWASIDLPPIVLVILNIVLTILNFIKTGNVERTAGEVKTRILPPSAPSR